MLRQILLTILFLHTQGFHVTATPRRTSSLAAKSRWITCSTTNEMVSSVSRLVKQGQKVAEIGSQLREVSTSICEVVGATGKVICLDVERKFPKQSNQETRTRAMRQEGAERDFYTNIASFYEMKSIDDWRLILLDQATDYDILVLDVNSIIGNDLEWTTMAIAREFSSLFPSCELIIIKSVSLNQWSARLVPGQRWIYKKGIHEDIPPPHIVATVGVTEYRKTIPFVVNASDRVLEIGCHFGTSTALLHDAGLYCIGVDIGPKIIRDAQDKYPHLHFSVGDAWKTADLLRIQKAFHEKQAIQCDTGFDVVYVDVGGLSGSDGLFEALTLLSALSNALEPRVIVIKSLCVQRLSSTLRTAWHILNS